MSALLYPESHDEEARQHPLKQATPTTMDAIHNIVEAPEHLNGQVETGVTVVGGGLSVVAPSVEQDWTLNRAEGH